MNHDKCEWKCGVICPASFARQTRAHLHNKDYIRTDKWDKWVAVVIGVAVLIVVALDSAWLMGWLK